MAKMKTLVRRLRSLGRILSGDCIILTVDRDTLKVDGGQRSIDELRRASTLFFRETYLPGHVANLNA